MATASAQPASPESPASVYRQTRRIGLWSAGLTALFAAITLGLGITTPPRTGVFCTSGCLTYPYAGAAAWLPGDMLWMIPALGAALAFLPLVVALEAIVPPSRGVAARVALVFAAIGSSLLIADYAIQFGVVAPSLVHGHDTEVLALSMYNPDGLYVALEDAAYAVFGLAFLALAAALPSDGRPVRAARWVLAIGGVLDLVAFAALIGLYGADIGYGYEVAGIAIDLLVLMLAGALVAIWLRRDVEAPVPTTDAP
jgi:hypothetical protein